MEKSTQVSQEGAYASKKILNETSVLKNLMLLTLTGVPASINYGGRYRPKCKSKTKTLLRGAVVSGSSPHRFLLYSLWALSWIVW